MNLDPYYNCPVCGHHRIPPFKLEVNELARTVRPSYTVERRGVTVNVDTTTGPPIKMEADGSDNPVVTITIGDQTSTVDFETFMSATGELEGV